MCRKHVVNTAALPRYAHRRETANSPRKARRPLNRTARRGSAKESSRAKRHLDCAGCFSGAGLNISSFDPRGEGEHAITSVFGIAH
jgi:hypothetical protein